MAKTREAFCYRAYNVRFQLISRCISDMVRDIVNVAIDH